MSRNTGTQPGNADRLRVLESELRRAQLSQNNTLEMLRRYQRFSGGGGAGINIIVARAQENVDHTMAVFDATVAAVFLGTGPAVDTVITVDNFDSGEIDEAAVGDILGTYRAIGLTGEEVFILLKGMNCMCFQKTGGNWQIFQAGGAFSEAVAPGDPISPFTPGLGA